MKRWIHGTKAYSRNCSENVPLYSTMPTWHYKTAVMDRASTQLHKWNFQTFPGIVGNIKSRMTVLPNLCQLWKSWLGCGLGMSVTQTWRPLHRELLKTSSTRDFLYSGHWQPKNYRQPFIQ